MMVLRMYVDIVCVCLWACQCVRERARWREGVHLSHACGHVWALSKRVSVLMTLPSPHMTVASSNWKKVWASACCIDHPQYCKPLHIHSSRTPDTTTERGPRHTGGGHPPPSPSSTVPYYQPNPPSNSPHGHSMGKSHVPLRPPAQVHLFSLLVVVKDFASIDRKAERITFWNSA